MDLVNLIGKTTIHPMLFYTGKLSGYATWVLFLLSLFKVYKISRHSVEFLTILSYILIFLGLIFTIKGYLSKIPR